MPALSRSFSDSRCMHYSSPLLTFHRFHLSCADDRIARGNNLTKMGSGSKPRDVAMLIAAQARAPVDCPTLQAIGPQATNQAIKAIAIARTFLKESDSIDICVQPEFLQRTCIMNLIRIVKSKLSNC